MRGAAGKPGESHNPYSILIRYTILIRCHPMTIVAARPHSAG
jgi:hypothetical protein